MKTPLQEAPTLVAPRHADPRSPRRGPRRAVAATALLLALAVAVTFVVRDRDGDPPDGSRTSPTTTADESTQDETSTSSGAAFGAVFGPECGSLPDDVRQPTSDPAATRMATIPVLTTFVTALRSVPGLLDLLDDSSAAYTIFAPTDSAFDALGAGTLRDLEDDASEPDSAMSQLLVHHVVPENRAPGAISGELEPLGGETVVVDGDPAVSPDTVTATDGVVQAQVTCGGIETGNATIYLVDMVLTQPVR